MADDAAEIAPEAVLLWPDGAPGARGDGPEDRPRLTPYLPAGPGPHAAIVICPGGGYVTRAPHEGAPVARWLNRLGVAAFVLDYRVHPYRHPCPLLDAQRALRLVRHRASEWRIDPARVGILGFSAGGHLAASTGTHFDGGEPSHPDPIERHSCRPDLMILCYPVITFGEHRHHGSMVHLLGEEAPAALRTELSHERQVRSDTPPAFLWHTADDAAVPVENSLLFAAALSRYRVPFALHIFPHGRHGLGLAEGDGTVGAWTGLCER
ncbi:MAG TPA: alpha/beta hydrolase, partial [Limnochordia bacterium]